MKKSLTIIALLMIVITTTGAGYVGTLPDIEAEFSYMKKQDKSERASAPYSVEQLDNENAQSLKPIPRENDTYVDIIVKKDKTTKYLKDVNSVIIILEKLRKCINNEQSIQVFNAIVSNLIDNVEYIKVEYKDKPEGNYLSYNRLQVVSNEAREVATFRTQGLAAQKYLPYTSSNNIYTKENLDEKLEKLLVNVNETLFILKNLD
ncbi:MAG: hypothetical protein IJY61_01140 [Candidatus Gastranaerophilales bacterium]|nr:hypothetical protein [Candidatus Gastranaerophilales bacterium]